MTVTNNTRQLKEAQKEISSMRLRINQLVDEIAALKSDVRSFKSAVSEDVKYLTQRVDS
jgi:cell division protein FtsB